MRAPAVRALLALLCGAIVGCSGASGPEAGDPAPGAPPQTAPSVETARPQSPRRPPGRRGTSPPSGTGAPSALGPVAPADAGPIAAPLLFSRSSRPRHADSVPDGKSGWLACDAALAWLVRHQSADGSWRGGPRAPGCTDDRCARGTDASSVVGDTALAIVALCATGWHESHGRAIRDGVSWLVSVQGPDGSLRATSSSHLVLDHALATEALCRAVGDESPSAHREAADRAVAHLLALRSDGGAWTDRCRGTTCDLRVTAWATMALADARLRGVMTPPDVYRDVLAWLDTDPCGAAEDAAVLRTCGRLFCGTTRRDPHLVADHALLTGTGAAGGAAAETFDAGIRYLATVAGFYWGGDFWERRRAVLGEVALPGQRGSGDGCLVGSWDPGDRPGPEGGRVAATALTSMLFDAAYISTYRNAVAERPLIPE